MFKKTILSLLIMISCSVSAQTYKFKDMRIDINTSYKGMSLTSCKNENCTKIEIKKQVVIDYLKKDIEMYNDAMNNIEKVNKVMALSFRKNSKIESQIYFSKRNKKKYVVANYESLTLSFPLDSSEIERVERIKRSIEYGKKTIEMSLKTIENDDFPRSFETEDYKEYRGVYNLFRLISQISSKSKK